MRGTRFGKFCGAVGVFYAVWLLACGSYSATAADVKTEKVKAAVTDAYAHAHDAHGHEEHGAHGHAEATVHGKPPEYYSILGPGTEFLYVDPVLFLFTVALFFIVATLLRGFAWMPIIASLDRREAKIAESLRKAEEARTLAAKLLAHHDEQMSKAHDEAKRILDEARAAASRDGEALIAQARASAAESVEKAEKDLLEAKESALAELREQSQGLASQMAEKVVRRPMRV